jgi:hypothetical protein
MNVNAALQVSGGAANMPAGMTGSYWTVAGFTGTIGTITGTYSGPVTSYDATVYSFTSGTGTFVVPTGAPVIVDYLIVGGGGGGGTWVGGGGGAGGLVYAKGVQLPAGSYAWTVGAGGTSTNTESVVGGSGGNSIVSNSTFGNITALGGGGGGAYTTIAGVSGGSGGGASYLGAGGAGAIGQGNAGGLSVSGGGGGGGAGAPGNPSTGAVTVYGGAGGSGLVVPITGSNVYYAGGGGGCSDSGATLLLGGLGGGGSGGVSTGTGQTTAPTGGIANTGGGGGGSGRGTGSGTGLSSASGAGGSGVIIIRVYTNTGSRMLIGDGSGYSLALSAQSNAVTTDVMTVTDQGNVTIGLSNAYFNGCHDAKFDSLGNMYVTDYGNHRIRKITPAGVVTTFLGNGSNTTLGGTGTGASIAYPLGLAIGVMSGTETLFATSAQVIIAAPLSTGVMTIIAGSNGVTGTTDSTTGTTARFNGAFGLALDTTNSYIFVADTTNERIRRIAYTGTYAVTTLGASGFVASATPLTLTGSSPRGLVYDGTTSNFYYTTNTAYGKIALTSSGTVATNTSNASGFTSASGITFNSSKTGVYFVDFGLHQVFSAGLGVAAATAIAGTSGVAGSTDATGLSATLNGPRSLTIDAAGSNLYIGDYGDNKIRKVNLATCNVTTYAGTGVAGFADGSVPTTTVVNNTLLLSSNVGINTTTPAYTLDVNGQLGLGSSSITGNYQMDMRTSNGFSTIAIAAFPNAYANLALTGDTVIRSNSNKVLIVSALGNGSMNGGICVSNSNVGIGTNAPAYTLDVAGTTRIGMGVTASTVSNYILLQNNAASDAATMRIGFNNYNGNLQSAIDCIQNSGSSFQSAFSFKTNTGSGPVEALYLSSAQRVGINNNAPTYTLDANGQIRLYAAGSGVTNSILMTAYGVTSNPVAARTLVGSIQFGSIGAFGPWLQAYQTGYTDAVDFSICTNAGSGNSAVVERLTVKSGVDYGRVGINCNAPQAALDVSGTIRVSASSYGNIQLRAPNENAIYFADSNAGDNLTGWFVGQSTSSIAGGSGFAIARLTTGNVLGSNGIYCLSSGKAGICCNAPGSTLTVAGAIYASGTITSNSDGRLKNVLNPISNGLEMLQPLNPVAFTMKDDATSRVKYGFIAQEISNALPELVYECDNEEKILHMTYSDLVGPLVAAVKELSARLSNVEAKLAATTTA